MQYLWNIYPVMRKKSLINNDYFMPGHQLKTIDHIRIIDYSYDLLYLTHASEHDGQKQIIIL